MRSSRFDLYQVLGVRSEAPASDIKRAFRTLAQKHHPDKNGNSPESTALFQTIQNAYSVLGDPASRLAYDRWLSIAPHRERGGRQSSGPGGAEVTVRAPRHDDTASLVLNHLNVILWEIEDLLRPAAGSTRAGGDRPELDRLGRDCILMMLTFIDEWVLNAAGFPDYFFRARGIDRAPIIGGTPTLPYGNLPLIHRPYAGLEDYFYDIRKRADRLLNTVRLADLLSPIRGTPVKVIDGILEAHNYCVHYLGWLKRAAEEGIGRIPPFLHSSPAFEHRHQ